MRNETLRPHFEAARAICVKEEPEKRIVNDSTLLRASLDRPGIRSTSEGLVGLPHVSPDDIIVAYLVPDEILDGKVWQRERLRTVLFCTLALDRGQYS